MKRLLSISLALFILLALGGCSIPQFSDITGGSGGTATAGETTTFTLEASATTTDLYSLESVTLTNIDFAYLEYLTITLKSPAGTAFDLVDTSAIRHFDGTYELVGASSVSDYSTLEEADQYDDNTKPVNTIVDGSTFQAAGSFSEASGEDPNGTWTLEITNSHGYRECTLEGFYISIGYYE